ncbi:chitin synthase chs-2-like [Haliotis cracherodii]|uniref:chitin synthase chs-2-like n=1 Tax=Haliotis cracherodii TaxID=6455 RepID=UPI0039E96F5F
MSIQGEDNPGFQMDEIIGDVPHCRAGSLRRSRTIENLAEGEDEVTTQPQHEWDRFEQKHEKLMSTSAENKQWRATRDRICKIVTIILLFLVNLSLLVVSKLSILSLTSHLGKTLTQGSETHGPVVEVRLVWALLLCIVIPSVMNLIISTWRLCIQTREEDREKKNIKEKIKAILPIVVCLATELVHSLGILLLTFLVFPHLHPITGCVLMSTVGLMPCITRLLSGWCNVHTTFTNNILKFVLAFLYIANFVSWRVLSRVQTTISLTVLLPVSVLMISVKWWDNYVGKPFGLSKKTTQPHALREFIVSLIQIATPFLSTIIFFGYSGRATCIRTLFGFERGARECSIFGNIVILNDNSKLDELCSTHFFFTTAGTAIICGAIFYILAVAACKAHIQIPCFSLPLLFSTPTTLGLLWLVYYFGDKSYLVCFFKNITSMDNMFGGVDTPTWICGSVSWILFFLVFGHIWFPAEERLAKREKLFVRPFYSGILVGESLTLSRRMATEARNTEEQICVKQAKEEDVPLVIACVTMWHETEREMTQVLRSIYRLAIDSCATRAWADIKQNTTYTTPKEPNQKQSNMSTRQAPKQQTQNTDRSNDDRYDFEAHIFLDDAFEETDRGDEARFNTWTEQLIRVVQVVAGKTTKASYRPTPYGGKLAWTLPGVRETALTAHLKDKTKIRNKKRWSQVMYLYYLLGFRCKKEDKLDNIFLLALDGDVDFQDGAVKMLLDRMRRDPDVGAACGRIHPIGIGTGPILWYQKFEYAVSHWLQKAAEHVTGCVLCSPGCFSLYRASALTSKDVIRKYATMSTEARHFVQYDQGEDRWLCTLLLQRGHKIEYCAASDSFTFAPEGFGEFLNQRKRWNPSTIANMLDLLSGWKHLTKLNKNISSIFLMYETALMVCLLLTPGTIFLLIIGAVNVAFPGIPLYGALIFNLIPVGVFILVCLYTQVKTQIQVAGVLCIFYMLLMMMVLVGLVLQADKHGYCSVTTIFLITIFGIFFSSALLHPQEFSCIFAGVVYFFFTPTMSMLMVIYSLCNLNNISWGTREGKRAARTEQNSDGQGRQLQSVWSRWTEGASALSSLCRCMCLAQEENRNILYKLDNIEKILQQPHDQVDNWSQDRVYNIPTHSAQERFIKAKEDDGEDRFWKELIEKYLQPQTAQLEYHDKIQRDLKELRNKSCLLFLVANSLLIILVLTLQMNPQLTMSLPCKSERFVGEDFEPISVTFMIVFGAVLVVQFTAMLIHRFSTFIHIISTTEIRQKSQRSEDKHNDKSAITIIKFIISYHLKSLHSKPFSANRTASDEPDGASQSFEKDFVDTCRKLCEERDEVDVQQLSPIEKLSIAHIAKKVKTTEACVKKIMKRVNDRNRETKEIRRQVINSTVPDDVSGSSSNADIHQTSVKEVSTSIFVQRVNEDQNETNCDETDSSAATFNTSSRTSVWELGRRNDVISEDVSYQSRQRRPPQRRRVSSKHVLTARPSEVPVEVYRPSHPHAVDINALKNETKL